MIKKCRQFFNDISLRTKLMVFLFVAGIVPLLFVFFYNYAVSRRQLTEQAYTNIDATAQQIASNIDDQFTSMLQTASVLSADSTLVDYLSKNYILDWDFVQAYRYIDHTLYNVLSTNTKISNIRLYTGNLSLPSDSLFIYHLSDVDEQELSWLQAQRTRVRAAVFRGVHQNRQGENVISLGCALTLSNIAHPQGYLVIDLKESALYSLFEKEAMENDIYIIDTESIIQSTRDKQLLSLPLAQTLKLKALPQENGHFIQQMGAQQAMVVCCSLSNGWRVVTTTPLSTIYGQVADATGTTLLVSLLCIICALILILQISHYFSSRFRLMNEQITRIEHNDFDIDTGPASKDEMGRLLAALGKMAATLDDAINETYRKEMQRKDAELTLLQSQINPHLLYNALSGITSLALSGRNKEVVEFTKHLSQFYKTSLNRGKCFVSIQEEVAITEHYIAIQNTRFGGMFHFNWEIDSSLLKKQTLKLLLQPLVENIVNHAVKDDSQPLETTVRIFREGTDILFVLQDNGIGIPKEKLKVLLDPQRASGYGLINVNARIQLHYGTRYGVSLQSTPHVGTRAVIRIPDTGEMPGPGSL